MDLSSLNQEQKKAAESLLGPVLILAGAGSGKTRALTYRLANLIDHGVKPREIMALTFTNKAAKEMKNRVEALVGAQAEDAWISTFHSSCARILRRDIEKLGYSRSFVIYDDDDQSRVLKEILKQLNIDDKYLPVKEIRGKISDAKNRMLTPDEWFMRSTKDRRSSMIHDAMTLYEQKLKSMNALDFDDLLIKTLELFADHPPVLQAYRNRFRYVMVDEYQDTNRAQYELVRLLTAESRNLCVVGDDDQSIYGWRGADIRNILDFEEDYPDAIVIKLEQNYRSTANILDAANQVIANNAGRKDKKLWTKQGDGEKIQLYCAMDERDESAWMADQILEEKEKTGSFGSIAILYRTNTQSRVPEEMLMKANIPYKVFGGQKFYERKEVKDILAYLRVIVNPADEVSLTRIINVPKRSIGDSTVQQLQQHAREQDMPLFAALSEMPESMSSRARKSVGDFFQMMTLLTAMKDGLDVESLVDAVIQRTGLEEQYKKEDTEDARARIGNIQEFRGAVHEYAQSEPHPTLEGYLENVALVTDLDQEEDQRGYVAMMTLHSAKGLEFDTVFIPGMEEGVFPSSRSIEGEERLEEERRLMYVGITRARKKLYLSRARERALYNQYSHNPPSRFLNEIPSRLIEQEWPETPVYTSVERSSTPRLPLANARRQAGIPYGGGVRQPAEKPESLGKPRLTFKGADLSQIPGVSKGFSAAKEVGTGWMQKLFQPGDLVMHPKFGRGTVISLSGSGANARVKICFDQAGERELSVAVAPIVKINE